MRTYRQNVKISDLTNVLLKPEPTNRWAIQDGITVLVCLAILATVVVVWLAR